MPTTKKPAVKAKPSEPKPKYSIGQKAFIIDRGRTRHGEVLQVEITARRSVNYNTVDESGKKTGSITRFEYDLRTFYGDYEEWDEVLVEPTITAASIAFAHSFTHLLK